MKLLTDKDKDSGVRAPLEADDHVYVCSSSDVMVRLCR